MKIYRKDWKQTLASMTLIALVPLASVKADIIFSDDFEAQTVDETPSAPWSTVTEGSNIGIRVRDDNIFGSDNQYLEFTKTTGSGAGHLFVHSLADPENVASLSFDFFDNGQDNSGRFALRLSNGTNSTVSAANTAFQFEFEDGTLTVFDGTTNESRPYDKGVANQIVFLANSSNAPVSYAGGTLAPESVDVWLNGAFLMTGIQRGQEGLSLNRLSMHIFADETNVDFSVDNVELHNTILPIPEPGTLVLLGIALGAVTLFRRRR